MATVHMCVCMCACMHVSASVSVCMCVVSILTWLPLVREKSGKFKVRESQGILCWVREICDFEKSQRNTGKSLESQGNLTFSCHTRCRELEFIMRNDPVKQC